MAKISGVNINPANLTISFAPVPSPNTLTYSCWITNPANDNVSAGHIIEVPTGTAMVVVEMADMPLHLDVLADGQPFTVHIITDADPKDQQSEDSEEFVQEFSLDPTRVEVLTIKRKMFKLAQLAKQIADGVANSASLAALTQLRNEFEALRNEVSNATTGLASKASSQSVLDAIKEIEKAYNALEKRIKDLENRPAPLPNPPGPTDPLAQKRLFWRYVLFGLLGAALLAGLWYWTHRNDPTGNTAGGLPMTCITTNGNPLNQVVYTIGNGNTITGNSNVITGPTIYNYALPPAPTVTNIYIMGPPAVESEPEPQVTNQPTASVDTGGLPPGAFIVNEGYQPAPQTQTTVYYATPVVQNYCPIGGYSGGFGFGGGVRSYQRPYCPPPRILPPRVICLPPRR